MDRVELRRGDAVIRVVESDREFYEALGYAAVKPARTRAKAQNSDKD